MRLWITLHCRVRIKRVSAAGSASVLRPHSPGRYAPSSARLSHTDPIAQRSACPTRKLSGAGDERTWFRSFSGEQADGGGLGRQTRGGTGADQNQPASQRVQPLKPARLRRHQSRQRVIGHDLNALPGAAPGAAAEFKLVLNCGRSALIQFRSRRYLDSRLHGARSTL